MKLKPLAKIYISIIAVLFLVGCDSDYNCAIGHMETIHHPSVTQLTPISTGKSVMLIPIYHEAYDSKEFICDEYKNL